MDWRPADLFAGIKLATGRDRIDLDYAQTGCILRRIPAQPGKKLVDIGMSHGSTCPFSCLVNNGEDFAA